MIEVLDIISNIDELYRKRMEILREEYKLTQTELDVLLFLYNNPDFDKACDIVNKRHLSKSHVSTSIKSLVEKKYLKGNYGEPNHKVIHLSICESAYPIVEEGEKIQIQYSNELRRGFSNEENLQLEMYIKRINENAKEALK